MACSYAMHDIAGDIKKLEVFETYCYRVQTNITLVEIMRQCRWHIEREFINTVKRRKLQYLSHMIRDQNICTLIFEGRSNGKRSRVEPRR